MKVKQPPPPPVHKSWGEALAAAKQEPKRTGPYLAIIGDACCEKMDELWPSIDGSIWIEDTGDVYDCGCPTYTDEDIVFCPWCGAKIEVVE